MSSVPAGGAVAAAGGAAAATSDAPAEAAAEEEKEESDDVSIRIFQEEKAILLNNILLCRIWVSVFSIKQQVNFSDIETRRVFNKLCPLDKHHKKFFISFFIIVREMCLIVCLQHYLCNFFFKKNDLCFC
jgi:hypothetical protein